MGMGIRFEGLSKEEVKALKAYIKERLDQLGV
jgi:hypothetical protein